MNKSKLSVIDEETRIAFANLVIKNTISGINDVRTYVDEYIEKNFKNILFAVIGVVAKDFHGRPSLCNINGFRGMFEQLIESRATEKAQETAEKTIEKIINDLDREIASKNSEYAKMIRTEYESSYRKTFNQLIENAWEDAQTRLKREQQTLVDETINEFNKPLAQLILQKFIEMNK